MKYILTSSNNKHYSNAEIMTVPWDFINQLEDSTNSTDVFVIDFINLIVDEIDIQFYQDAFNCVFSKNPAKKIFAISNDPVLIDSFQVPNIKFVDKETMISNESSQR
jgi:hypothetical protein